MRQPPALATRKMKKMTTWARCLRERFARSSGRMSSMAAPVVPTQLARKLPMSRMTTLFLVVPAMVPPVTVSVPDLMPMPP